MSKKLTGTLHLPGQMKLGLQDGMALVKARMTAQPANKTTVEYPFPVRGRANHAAPSRQWQADHEREKLVREMTAPTPPKPLQRPVLKPKAGASPIPFSQQDWDERDNERLPRRFRTTPFEGGVIIQDSRTGKTTRVSNEQYGLAVRMLTDLFGGLEALNSK